jgi:hypothetical protein
MRFKTRSDSPLKKKARRGFRGFPVATIAFYGPTDERASKVAVGIVIEEGAEPAFMERWFDDHVDLRKDAGVAQKILAFIQSHGVKSVVMMYEILRCPHEEGIDYPDGGVCPHCPFWADREGPAI